jgi:hypothetical protein
LLLALLVMLGGVPADHAGILSCDFLDFESPGTALPPRDCAHGFDDV